jgi:hypothetical protein
MVCMYWCINNIMVCTLGMYIKIIFGTGILFYLPVIFGRIWYIHIHSSYDIMRYGMNVHQYDTISIRQPQDQ